MEMIQNELIKQAYDLNFKSYFGLMIGVHEDCYYLWMCDLQKWLRKEHLLEIHIECMWEDEDRFKQLYSPWLCYTREEEDLGLEEEDPEYFNTYEQALESVLLEAVKLIK